MIQKKDLSMTALAMKACGELALLALPALKIFFPALVLFLKNFLVLEHGREAGTLVTQALIYVMT